MIQIAKAPLGATIDGEDAVAQIAITQDDTGAHVASLLLTYDGLDYLLDEGAGIKKAYERQSDRDVQVAVATLKANGIATGAQFEALKRLTGI